MKQVIIKIAFVFLSVALLVTCKRDLSLETENSANSNATGTLLDSAGSCQSIGVFGNYIKDSILTDSNFISVQVNFTTTGKYLIQTDTVNGFWFIDSAYIFSAGTQTIKVKGHGKPLLLLNPTFVVSFNNSNCFFVVPIVGAAGSTTPTFATYSLAGDPNSCTGALVQGTYTTGQALTAANTAVIQVNVTAPGGYSISTTTTDGMQFKRNGIFDNTGNYAVTLYGTGTPIDSGTTIIPITAGSSICSFPVQVVGATTNSGSGGSGSGGGGGTTVSASNTWQFNAGGKSLSGTIAAGDATLTSVVQSGLTVNTLTITGKTAGDSTLVLTLFLINSSLKTGTYSTSSVNAFSSVLFDFSDYANNINSFYHADNTDQTNVMTLVITSYNAATKVVTGTFSGKAGTNGSTTSTAITSGSFSATLQ